MSQEQIKITGHLETRKRLHDLLEKDKLHSTLLFCGQKGIGKNLAALELSRALLCEGQNTLGGCGVCSSCLLAGSGNHLDIQHVDCDDKDQWNAKTFREFLYTLHLKPYRGLRRVVIIDNSENLGIQSSNSLLKTLEEPNQNNWFILIASNASKLPITIRSRCQVWNFFPLTPDEISTVIMNKKLLGEDADKYKAIKEIASLADGSLDTVDVISEHLDMWEAVQRELKVIADGNIPAANQTAQTWGKEAKDILRVKLQLARAYCRQSLFREQESRAKAQWAACMTNLIEADHYIFERNINATLVLEHILLRLVSDNSLNSFTTTMNSGILLSEIFPDNI